MRNYLTKSVFKVGLECPRKLFYHKKPHEYLNGKEEDAFLESLAQGGYQVGELAKLKYPAGTEILEHSREEASKKTQDLLAVGNGVLFEAAFSSGGYFVRSDIVTKHGSSLKIIEVKSKSFEDPDDGEESFISPRGSKPGAPKLYSKWIPYLYDLAFQVFVAKLNNPELQVTASLMLLDKTAGASEDGLHQLFLVKKNGKSKEVIKTKAIPADFDGYQILTEVDVTSLVNDIIDGKETSELPFPGPMDVRAKGIAEIYIGDLKVRATCTVGSHCKKCEFRGQNENLKSGFDECWLEKANIQAASSQKMAFDLWNFRGADAAIQGEKYLLANLEESDLGKKPSKTSARQMIQIEKVRSGSSKPWFDISALKAEIESWTWPLHFIDFETCTPAIPFHKNFPPYAEVAFQFSHHIMQKDGEISHAGEFIELSPGKFPSFEFLRALKQQLEKDNGTIFRYSSHENSVLNRIARLLERSNEADRAELISFVKTITKKKDGAKKDAYLWNGHRCMVDLLEVVKECYLSPLMGGSNSLKYVLPAILNESEFLRTKYSKPIYGTPEFPSMNFRNHVWAKVHGKTIDPYAELPPLFTTEELSKIDSLVSDEDQIRNGGAAMMAYCRTQFTEMSEVERDAIRKSLLKYCELDTLAMVMLVEYFLTVI